MSTLSDILIQYSDKKEIISFLSKDYEIGNIKSDSELELLKYFNIDNEVRTFVIHKDKNDDWTQIDYEMGESTQDLKEFDNLILQMTQKFQCKAIIAYEQTTSGACRFAFFENGKIIRSIIQTYLFTDDKIRITENLGDKFDFENYEYKTDIGEEIDYEELLSYYDDFQDWIKKLGFKWTNEYGAYNDYIHLEILNKK